MNDRIWDISNMPKLDDKFPYSVAVMDNGREEMTAKVFIWHEGDIYKWAVKSFGVDKLWETWTCSGQNPTVYYFSNEKDYTLFCLRASESIVKNLLPKNWR